MFRTPKEQNSRDRNDFLPSLPSELLVLVRKGTCGSCARRLGSGRAPRGWLRAGPDCLNKGARPFLRSIRSIPEGWAGLASQMMTLGVETHSDFPPVGAPSLWPRHLEAPCPSSLCCCIRLAASSSFLCGPLSLWLPLLALFLPGFLSH